MIRDAGELLERLRQIHAAIVEAVLHSTTTEGHESLAAVVDDGAEMGDTIFAIDRVSEERLVELFSTLVAPKWPLVLIAEGLPDVGDGPGALVLPRGTTAAAAELRVIVDPIDGTRGLMYQKRSAWVLTGVAPNKGSATRLAHIELALQTEVPLVKQYLYDQLWAQRGAGMQAARVNRLTGERSALDLRPSASDTLDQGFATVSRFFPGARAELAAIDDEVVARVLGPVQPYKAQCFEDQYISTGGQLYELIAGHDRFVADLRPLTEALLARGGRRLGICCHPYDLAAVLIAHEAGVIVTACDGGPLDAPLDVATDVAWVGYANDALRRRVEPALRATLRDHGLLTMDDA